VILDPVSAGIGRSKQHFTTSFSWLTPAGGTLIGSIPAGFIVSEVLVRINQIFNQLVFVEVGQLSAPAELMVGTDSNVQIIDTYKVDCDHQYNVPTALYLTLLVPGLVPTQGLGEVIVYVS
jgi:hypothetical protein